MISFGFELLVIEIMGVMWSNCRISDVAEIPSNLGMTMSYGKIRVRNMKLDILINEKKQGAPSAPGRTSPNSFC